MGNNRYCANCKYFDIHRIEGIKCRCVRWSAWVDWNFCCNNHEWLREWEEGAMQSDLISRSALIEIFKDLSDIEWNQKAAPISWADAYDSFVDVLEDAPAVDAVEVVRCKDCVHYVVEEEYEEYGCECCCGLTQPEPFDFCRYGERRADDE